MAYIYYENRNAARKLEPLYTPQTPAPQRGPAPGKRPGPDWQPGGTPEQIRAVQRNRIAAVFFAILLVLAWVVPSLVADASAELNAAAFAKANQAYEDALRENTRLRNEVRLAISAEDAYDTAVGEYGMVAAEEEPVILNGDAE